VTVEAIEWVPRSSPFDAIVATPGEGPALDSLLPSPFEGSNQWVDPATGEAYDLGEGLSLPARTQAGQDRVLFLLVDAGPGISAFDPLIEEANARLICVWHSYTDLDLNLHYPGFGLPTCLGEQVAGTRISDPLAVAPPSPK
jgi:hypothetical protein